MIQCYLGIKPTKDGIFFSPCTKKRWKKAAITFSVRGGQYTLEILNPQGKELHDFKEMLLNGKKLEGNVIPYSEGNNRILIIY